MNSVEQFLKSPTTQQKKVFKRMDRGRKMRFIREKKKTSNRKNRGLIHKKQEGELTPVEVT